VLVARPDDIQRQPVVDQGDGQGVGAAVGAGRLEIVGLEQIEDMGSKRDDGWLYASLCRVARSGITHQFTGIGGRSQFLDRCVQADRLEVEQLDTGE